MDDSPRTFSRGGVHGRTLVVIPTYNEATNLDSIVRRVRVASPHVHVLIVDDNSPDGTGDIADDLSRSDGDRVHVLHRRLKAGLGAAYVAGFEWGIERKYSVIVEMDADGSHAPEQISRLLDAVGAGADVVIGSRYVGGGQTLNWPRRRRFLSRTANLYARAFLGTGVRDITAGFRAYRADVLDGFGLESIASMGYCFQIDLTWRAICEGLTIVEVPITFSEREHGTSKMDFATVLEAVGSVARWGIEHRLNQIRNIGRPIPAEQRRDRRVAGA